MSGTNPLDGLRPGPAPRELRARVLAAAAEARVTATARAHWIDRAWESRALRLAWTATMLAALLGHLTVTMEVGARRAAPSDVFPPFAPSSLASLPDLEAIR